MKRMYVTLFILFGVLFWTFGSFGQKKSSNLTPEEKMMQRLQMREEMHRRMMDKILRGIGPNDDLFADMEKMFEDSMADMDMSFQSVSGPQHFSSQWIENPKSRTLVVIPQTPGQKLDINVQNQMVTIKGSSEVKSAQGTSVQNFSSSFSVPGDCDDTKMKISEKDGKIFLEFPYRNAVQEVAPKDGKKPVGPSGNEVSI